MPLQATVVAYPDAEHNPGDGQPLIKALQDHFELVSFKATFSSGSWSITVDDTDPTTLNLMRMFAQGFMASAHLWER